MNRAEHLAWCKERALEYLDRGDFDQALASMVSDMNKHPETEFHNAGILWLLGLQAAMSKNYFTMRRWIEGFN